MGCDTGQYTDSCGFDSRSTCARLLGATMLCVGFPQPPLRLSSVFTILRKSFRSALYLRLPCTQKKFQFCTVPPYSLYSEKVSFLHCTSVAFTVLRAVPAEKTARSYRHQSLPYRLSLVREIKKIHSLGIPLVSMFSYGDSFILLIVVATFYPG